MLRAGAETRPYSNAQSRNVGEASRLPIGSLREGAPDGVGWGRVRSNKLISCFNPRGLPPSRFAGHLYQAFPLMGKVAAERLTDEVEMVFSRREQVLAAARSQFGSNSPLDCYSLPNCRFATPPYNFLDSRGRFVPTKVARNMLYHEYCGRAQRPAPTAMLNRGM